MTSVLPDVRSGFCRTANAVSGRTRHGARKVLTHFAATEGNVWRQTTFFLLPLAPAGVSVRVDREKRKPAARHALFPAGACCLAGRHRRYGGARLGTVSFFGAEALLIVTAFYRGWGFRLRTDGGATVSAAGSVALILCVTLGLSALFIPVRGYEKERNRFRHGSGAGNCCRTGALRENGKPCHAPEGDFRNLGDLVFPETTALQVAMSQPDSLYLRGFVGELYRRRLDGAG